jgi:tetratricopeptide (TPR) repeat protein
VPQSVNTYRNRPGSTIAQDSRHPRGSSQWILDHRRDLPLFIATPILIVPLAMIAKSRLSLEEIALYVAAFGAVGHHLPGMMRAYADRELFERFKLRFLLSPLFLLTICVLFQFWRLSGLQVLLLLWGVWHGLAQVYGFARIYDAKVASIAPLTARLDWCMCVAWFGAGMLYSPGRMALLLEAFYQSGGPLLPAAAVRLFQSAWGISTLVITLLFLANILRQWRQGRSSSPVKLWMMIISFGFWWYAMVGIANVVVGIALFEIFHDVQYLSIVWVYNRKRVDRAGQVGPFMRFLFRQSGVMIGLYVGMVLAYGYVKLLADRVDRETVQQALFGFITASTFLHFYFDGFIWKVREKTVREGLGLEGGRSENQGPAGFPGWLAHGLNWSLFVVPVCLLGFSQSRSSASTLEQSYNLVAAAPDSSYAHHKLGIALESRGRIEEAIEHYRQELQINPDAADAHNRLGVALESRGLLDEAIDHYRQALKARPGLTEAEINLGIALRSQGKLDEAIAYFRQALQRKPTSAEAYINLGIALESQGNLPEAIAQYRQAIHLKPTFVEAHNNLGLALASQGRLDEAITQYLQALQLNSKYVEAYDNLGTALASKGRLEEAISRFQQALHLKPDSPEAHNNLGIALASQGRMDEAINQFRQALQASPAFAEAHNNLGLAFQSRGNVEEAISCYRLALKNKPDWPAAMNRLAWILATHPDSHGPNGDVAVGLAERAAELTQYRELEILDSLAAAYAAANRFDRAVTTAQAALALASADRLNQRADGVRRRLKLYSQGKPYREP